MTKTESRIRFANGITNMPQSLAKVYLHVVFSKKNRELLLADAWRDELFKVPTRATYTGLEHLWLPGTVLKSDFVVSMPKIKTHHWAGVTLTANRKAYHNRTRHHLGARTPLPLSIDLP